MSNIISPAFYVMLFMALPCSSAGQVPQKDNSPTTVIEYVALIDILQDGESYEIKMISKGCFVQTSEKLVITREGNYYLVVSEGRQSVLNQDQLQALRDFEIGIRSVLEGGCTTTETYILTFRSESLQFSDTSCAHWFGKELMKKLDL